MSSNESGDKATKADTAAKTDAGDKATKADAAAKTDAGDKSTATAASEKINQLIKDNKVVVFSATYCPYCKKAKKILGNYKIKSYKTLEVDEEDDTEDYFKAFKQLTGAETVPRVFIDGKCIGGGDDTEKLDKSGELEKKLKEIGALED